MQPAEKGSIDNSPHNQDILGQTNKQSWVWTLPPSHSTTFQSTLVHNKCAIAFRQIRQRQHRHHQQHAATHNNDNNTQGKLPPTRANNNTAPKGKKRTTSKLLLTSCTGMGSTVHIIFIGLAFTYTTTTQQHNNNGHHRVCVRVTKDIRRGGGNTRQIGRKSRGERRLSGKHR